MPAQTVVAPTDRLLCDGRLPRPVVSHRRMDKAASLTDPVGQGETRDGVDRLAAAVLRAEQGVWP